MTGFGKAVGMGPIARAHLNPQFSDANAGQRGYNRRHFPAGDAARMEEGRPLPPQINVADAFSRGKNGRAETRAIKKGRAFVERRSRSIVFVSTPAREFLII